MRLKLAVLALCLSGSASAQQPKLPSAVPPDRYSVEAAVMEHIATVYRYAADGTGSKQLTVAVRAQTEAALRQLGVVTISFASAEEHVDFDYVRVRRLDGTVVETPASEAQEMSSEVTRQAPLYSDLKEKQLPVRSLRAGDTLEYQVRVVRTVAEAPGEIWGIHPELSGLVVLDESIELHLPASKSITVWSPTTKPVIKDENGERIYRWTGSHLDPTAGPKSDAKKEADKTRTPTPVEALDLQYGKLPLIAWTTFKTWDAVGAWYRSLETGRTVADPNIKTKVAELVSGKTTDDDKLRAIYNYVATSIRYIGVDLGVGRYQPHLASEVLRNQYGDCKDKHTLLAAMLIQAGFNPSAVLIGVNIRFNPDVPSPASFNHVITQLPPDANSGGKPIWLDSTQEVAPYRALLAPIRNKDSLVVPLTGLARIEKTPDTLPFPSVEHFQSTGTLTSAGISDSHIVLTMRGDDELLYRMVLHQLSPGQYGDFIQGMSQNLGFAGTTSHPEISRPESTTDPVSIAYDYKREKPGDWDNLRIYPQLSPVGLGAPDEKNPPKIPIELGLPRIESATSALKLPDGWGATLPADIQVKAPFATFDKTYRLDKGTLYADRKLEILKTEIPAADWKTLKKFTDDIALNNEPTIQLNTAGGNVQLPSGVNNEEAAALMKKATAEIQARKFDEALADLDKAKALNESQYNLYALYAFRSSVLGNLAETITYSQKELKLHPDNLYPYGAIVAAQIALNQRKEAEQTLRDRLSHGAPDDKVSLQLASMFSADEDFPAAIGVLETAKSNAPDKPNIQLALGRAYIKAGNIPEGSAILTGLIKTSDEPGILNDSAYDLANANLELDLAETTVRKALDKYSKQTADQTAELTSEADSKKALSTTRLTVAAWDTLGWVLFRQHKLNDAEAYIRAAWLQGQHAEVCLHLGEIEEAQGKPSDALATYRLAASASIHRGVNGARLPPSPLAKEIASHIATLYAANPQLGKLPAETEATFDPPQPGKLSKPDPDFYQSPTYALQQLRTIQLGSSGDMHGVREFTVTLCATGVLDAKATGTQPELKNDDAIVHRLDTKSWWPASSPVKLVRKGVLTCQENKCEFVYIPL